MTAMFIIALAVLPIALIAFLADGVGRDAMLIAYGLILSATYALAQVIGRLLWIGIQKKRIDRAKDEFLSFASHQLRTPLTTMNWRLEMLLAGDAGKLSKNQAGYVREVEHETRRMTKLVTMFLNVSRINLGTLSLKSQPCNVGAVVKNVLAQLAPAIKKKRLRVSSRYENADSTIPCDASLVLMVVQNLISNAIKYTHTGGSIDIGIKRDGKELILTVTDTGIGIPKEAYSLIFSKLFRALNARREDPDGSGLGLYVVKSLLGTAGGRVWFESTEGRGSTFSIALPLTGTRARVGNRALSFSRGHS